MSDRRIRVLHVIPSLSLKHGGPSYAVRAMARALASVDVDVTIATTDDDGDDSRFDVPLGTPIQRDGITHFFFRRNFVPYKISFGLRRWLDRSIANFDVVHIHALFSFSSTVAAHAAQKHEVPYVIRPLGVLNQWGMQHRRRILKSISFRTIEVPILRKAGAIHFTTDSERDEAELAISNLSSLRSVVIPLPIQTKEFGDKPDPEKFLAKFPEARNKEITLFLSRLHPKKGIELLLEAFADIRRDHPSAVLVIAGEGSSDYVSILRRRTGELGIMDHVIWTGFLEGEEKWAAFAVATVFVLPSFSENFGISAAEALVQGVPTVITQGVGLADEIKSSNAGIVVEPTVAAIAHSLDRLLENSEARSELATRGRQLAMERFSTEFIGRALKRVYEEAINPTIENLKK